MQAVVDWYGPVDFAERERQLRAAGSECRRPQIAQADAAVTAYLGADVDTVPVLAAQSDPVTYIRRPGRCPRSRSPTARPTAGSRRRSPGAWPTPLRRTGATPDERILPGFTHGDLQFDADVMAPTITWLDGVLAR